MTNPPHGYDRDVDVESVRSRGTERSASRDGDEPNEIDAVRKDAKKETRHVQMWRIAVTTALVMCGIAVTWITYDSLKKEQVSNFETAYAQFARTVGDAAAQQQQDLRVAYQGFADSITTYVQSTDSSWPTVTIPYFRKNADAILKQSRTEGLLLMHAVEAADRAAWENYTVYDHEAMVQEAHMLENGNLNDLNPEGFHGFIGAFSSQGFVPDQDRDVHFPVYEYAPAPFSYGLINWNAFTDPVKMETLYKLKSAFLFGPVAPYDVALGISLTQEEHKEMHAGLTDSNTEHPHSFFDLAVRERVEDLDSKVVAILSGAVAWDAALNRLLPQNVRGMIAVIKNNCNQSYTYQINGEDAIFLGDGDRHDSKYNKYEKTVDLSLSDDPDYIGAPGHCRYTMHLFPSRDFEKPYDTSTPTVYAIVVLSTFLFVVAVFFVYDLFVYKRNEKLIENVARSNVLVSTLFPENIRQRLFEDNDQGQGNSADKRIANLKNYLNGHTAETSADKKPLADLFLETSVLFADIAGFTAWSSEREPSQVFTFLETIFSAFDQIAKRRRVFKVETVGDCYVAATGIPEPRKDHAVVMVRFAKDVLARTNILAKELVVSHGPDTGDLNLRVGIHSGPVTAGVLRGERARFQLFGDTINTASRIEHTGKVGRIQVSAETAECLRSCGKGAWLLKRDELVAAKGKGNIQTYWIKHALHARDDASQASANELVEAENMYSARKKQNEYAQTAQENGFDERTARLVDWNVGMLLQIIQQILARREAVGQASKHTRKSDGSIDNDMEMNLFTPLEEVKEIITLPDFDHDAAHRQQKSGKIEVDPAVVRQLRSLVTNIASMYRPNSFHNFEHASHVTMSVIKLLARIIAPADIDDSDNVIDRDHKLHSQSLHDHTYGITSDPLTQFACAFSAMIHDVDHTGVPNAQLVKEKVRIAEIYDNRSVAEQNSLVLSWELFMSDEYNELRKCICSTSADVNRFRQLVVNAVMATDIVDKEMKQLRNNRWDKAFNDDFEENANDATNRKATIIIEHLIQASDVAHTMQHWHVYRKWNDRFFRECYAAYKSGRAESNPVDTWYKGEIGFFDFYIIPLAKKLKDCGVFGKSSDEYLNYAMANRQEWEQRGEEIVADMVASMEIEIPTDDDDSW